MYGAILGDIIGSRFEWDNYKGKDFEFYHPDCRETDDSLMTLAVGMALKDSNEDFSDLEQKAVYWMQRLGRAYPRIGYGPSFRQWLFSDDPQPYNSWGNGAAMRVSAAGWAANSLEEAEDFADKVTRVSHDHPEAIKAAKATSKAIWMGRQNKSKEEIEEAMKELYDLDFMLDDIRDEYTFDVSCQGTMPVAIKSFLESTSLEDAIRNAVSVGGDSDTIAAITGSIAEAYYGIDEDMKNIVREELDKPLLAILELVTGEKDDRSYVEELLRQREA